MSAGAEDVVGARRRSDHRNAAIRGGVVIFGLPGLRTLQDWIERVVDLKRSMRSL